MWQSKKYISLQFKSRILLFHCEDTGEGNSPACDVIILLRIAIFSRQKIKRKKKIAWISRIINHS